MPTMKKPQLNLRRFEGQGPEGMYGAKPATKEEFEREAAFGYGIGGNDMMNKMQTIDQSEVLRLSESDLLKMLEEC